MGNIFLLAGAPAVGKSTTARALAAQFPKSLHIPVDDVRNMVVSGLVQPGEWTPSLVEQLRLARVSVTEMALTYHRAGFTVVIDDFWDPNSLLLEYGRLFQDACVHKVLLVPSRQAAEERNLKRSGPGDVYNYLADGIRQVYSSLETQAAQLQGQGWLLIDSTHFSVSETVTHILAQAALHVSEGNTACQT